MSIRKHTLYNLAGSLLPLGLSLVTIPIYIHLIGESRYGVLAMAWLFLGYFGLFDLGLGRATAQRIASLAGDHATERARTFWTALCMNSGLGIVGGLLIWPAAIYFFGHALSIETALRPELNAAIPWMILAVPLATVSGVLSGAMQGVAQFFETNFISVASAILTQILPLAVAWLHGPDLAWLMPAVIFSRLITLAALFWRCRIHVFQGQAFKVSRLQAKGLLKFGGWVTVSSLVGPMMEILDRFVIGAHLGAKQVTYYTVPYQLSARTTLFSTALTTALFPRLASANSDDGKFLAATAIKSLAVVMTPPLVVGVLLIRPFLRIWLGQDFASHAALSGEILLIGFWFNALASIPYAQLQATNRPHLVAHCHLVEVLPYLGALYLGLHLFGLAGAAVVFGLRTSADCGLLMHFAKNLRQSAALLSAPTLLLLAALGVAEGDSPGSFVWLIGALILIASTLAWAWINAPKNLRDNLVVRLTGAFSLKSDLSK